ncbi:Ninja family [Parasponia andersonii]|uniref:Ninja-family protein n=1 Tax=Parasponia andersonii TaxID=3476 RepID=A0A2P5E2E3_PARAD|nr:Ninja family [Parasponia andersonii]
MGEANEGGRSRGGGSSMENLSLQMEKYPRDLLQRLVCSSNTKQQSQNDASFGIEEEEEDSEEVELNLGLSLGGRFGVDKNATKKSKLTRSSSIVGTMPLVRDQNDDETTAFPPPVSYPALMRTSSLPTETEEEWRKRKELQTLRRLAAKRRRTEKQRNSAKAEKEQGSSAVEAEERRSDNTAMFSSSVGPPLGLPTWAAAARQAQLGAGADALMAKSKGGVVHNASQGSVESQGGSSSGMSELESKPIQGSSSHGEARSPPGHQSSQERSQENMGPSGTKTTENKCTSSGSKMEIPSKNPIAGGNKGREIGMNTMEDMPCVFTKGDGPNGKRIDGILYRYGKGEEVRIMCVCHGSFLSPAEFVKHAGGGDVAHPLRHIVINPSSSFLS